MVESRVDCRRLRQRPWVFATLCAVVPALVFGQTQETTASAPGVNWYQIGLTVALAAASAYGAAVATIARLSERVEALKGIDGFLQMAVQEIKRDIAGVSSDVTTLEEKLATRLDTNRDQLQQAVRGEANRLADKLDQTREEIRTLAGRIEGLASKVEACNNLQEVHTSFQEKRLQELRTDVGDIRKALLPLP